MRLGACRDHKQARVCSSRLRHLAWTIACLLAGGCGYINAQGYIHAPRTGDLSHAPAPRIAYDRDLKRCGSAQLSDDGRAIFDRAPYLQQVTPRSAMVMWTTASLDAMQVLVTRADGQPQGMYAADVDISAPLVKGRTMITRIDRLEPATQYCYKVVAGGRVLLDATGFVTAPPGDSNEPIRFVSMGDLGIDGPDQRAVRDQIARVPFSFALINGDVAYDNGNTRELDAHFFAVYAPMLRHVPFFVASGNHDYYTDDAAPFRRAFALFENGGPEGHERWYSFDWGPLHVVVLDTELSDVPAQAAWLDADLRANRQPWTVVSLHRPPFSSGAHGDHEPTKKAFVPLFSKHKVPLVLAGHDHNYERTAAIDGVTYIVAGAGGRGTRPVGSSPFTAFAERVSHFVLVTIDGANLTVNAIDGSGHDFDSVRIKRP